MSAIKDKYLPGNLYNRIKDILMKHWNRKKLLGIHSSGYITNLDNDDISDSNIKREEFIGQLWNNIKKELHLIVRALNKIDN